MAGIWKVHLVFWDLGPRKMWAPKWGGGIGVSSALAVNPAGGQREALCAVCWRDDQTCDEHSCGAQKSLFVGTPFPSHPTLGVEGHQQRLRNVAWAEGPPWDCGHHSVSGVGAGEGPLGHFIRLLGLSQKSILLQPGHYMVSKSHLINVIKDTFTALFT